MPGIRKQPPHRGRPPVCLQLLSLWSRDLTLFSMFTAHQRPSKHFSKCIFVPVHNPFSGEETWYDNGITCLQDRTRCVTLTRVFKKKKKKKPFEYGGVGECTLNAPQQICWRLSGSQNNRGIQSRLVAASQQQKKKKMPLFCFILTFVDDARFVNGRGIFLAIAETTT